eukprot:TRINITY_DN8513_c0_g1_i2.p1 TRINITY_DN8513_c0_g1~~TRINITY_DN8513_c0_g1_i2.p1  ORF type:complete len:857 (+),score=181.54 TRINITY_DN8513_c0_g1_i2:132-2702(+)
MGHLSNGFQNGMAQPGFVHYRGPKPAADFHAASSQHAAASALPNRWESDELKDRRRTTSGDDPTPGLVMLMLVAAVLCFMFLPNGFAGGSAEGYQLPQRITTQATGSNSSTLSQQFPPPALRGCCGEPTEFQWLFLDGSDQAEAGRPFRTLLVARDARGRQARPASCGALRVALDLSGKARLSGGTLPLAWRRAELELPIENEFAEVVKAEVRIESPLPEADVLLHTSQIRFASGPAHSFLLSVEGPEDGANVGRRSGGWPVFQLLTVIASMKDRFGNPTMVSSGSLAGGGLLLRSNVGSDFLEIRPGNGMLNLDSSGQARVVIQSLRAGKADIWLEQASSNATEQQRQQLRASTAHELFFQGISSPPAALSSSPSAALAAARALAQPSDAKWQAMADQVRDAFLHAWTNYEKFAWGKDELQPVSRSGKDTFGGFGLTILDSLSTLWLMGLDKEFEKGKEFVRDELDFDKADSEVSVFELTIRGVGGLLGAHTLSGDKVFLERAKELGARLLPAFKTASKLPLPSVNIARGRGQASNQPVILSEAGSVQLEFRSLAARTGDVRFKQVADDAYKAIQSTGVQGILPVFLSPPQASPPQVVVSKFAFGALADSYYEYLLKQWLQSPLEKHFKDNFLRVMDALPSIVRPLPSSVKKKEGDPVPFKMIELSPDGSPVWKMDHLSCFAPALIALGLMTLPKQDLQKNERNSTLWHLAEGLTASCSDLWTSTASGLAPEFAMVSPQPPHDFKKAQSDGHHSFLRPETAESLFYLYRLTGDEKYRKLGEKHFNAILQNAKVEAGFSSVRDVTQVPTSKMDEMQTFVMAETFKYLFLLFSPAASLDMDHHVLNTEGHPLTRAEL